MTLREVSLEWFVGYGDADAFGTVLWSRYADWAARANSMLWKANRSDPPDTGVLRSCALELEAPAAFEDTLAVRARYVRAGRTSFDCEVAFVRPDDVRVAVATLRMVSVDEATGRPTEVPDWLWPLRSEPDEAASP